MARYDHENESDDGGAESGNAASRREALRKIGVYGAFTAPALLATLSAARAQSSSPIGPPITGVCTVTPPSCTFF